ncbi:hypothetical protein ACFLZO_00885 [Patescibacteria group bacterium]
MKEFSDKEVKKDVLKNPPQEVKKDVLKNPPQEVKKEVGKPKKTPPKSGPSDDGTSLTPGKVVKF